MQNLEQIRAAAALSTAPKTTRADANKLPALILSNGLLAAIAFATELGKDGSYKRPGMAGVLDGAAKHLANRVHGMSLFHTAGDARSVAETLSQKGSALDLQRATRETLAFIGYVKRYADKESDAD